MRYLKKRRKNMKKILVTMTVDDDFREKMLAVADPNEYELIFKGNAAKGEADIDADDVKDVSAVLGHLPPRLMPYAEKLEWLQTQSAGVDRYLSPPVLPENVILTNAVGGYGVAVSEHMTALTLSVMKNLPMYSRSQFSRTWLRGSRNARQIEGSTVLVLGMGNIGTNYARQMKGLGCFVIGVRRNPDKPMPEYFDEQYSLDQLDIVLPRADILAMIVPGGDPTRGMIDARRIALMKDGAVLVNAGRGVSVDTAALVKALKNGKLSGAGLDVTDPEPVNGENELWGLDNVIITPHVAGMLEGNRDRVSEILLENLEHFCKGEPLKNVVDKKLGY